MTIQTALMALEQHLDQVDGALRNLEWAVLQAQPDTDLGQGLAAQLGDRLTELMGVVVEAQELAQLGRQVAGGQSFAAGQAVGGLGHSSGLRQALVECHARCNRIGVLFFNRLYAADVAEALDWLERDGQEDWITWVYGVKDGLERCLKVLMMDGADNLNQALLQCWQELTDHPALVSVSLNGLSVGPVQGASNPPGAR